jgi:hypothetical protein
MDRDEIMSHVAEKLPDEPIVILTIYEDFDFVRENLEIYARLTDLIEGSHELVVLIANMLHASIGLNTIISGANFASRGIGAIFHHPSILQVVFVTTSKLVDLAAAGLNSPVFGNLHVKVFPTLDSALAYVREKASEG